MGWVFQGSPKQFDIDDYLSRYPELIYWRTPRYAADIAIGDRIFVWRAGGRPRAGAYRREPAREGFGGGSAAEAATSGINVPPFVGKVNQSNTKI